MLKKITIVSNNICYGPEPPIGAEVEQKLTLNSKGQVWFSGYIYNRDFGHFPLGRKLRKKIPAEIAENLLKEILDYFTNNETPFITDVGDFEANLFFDDETEEEIRGSLFTESKERQELCGKMRKAIGVDNLFLFDGICKEYEQ